jgi:hypothetical protein
MIIFVADMYKKDYVGGAELTSDAILQDCPYDYKTFYSIELTKEKIEKNKNCFWIFSNISDVKENLLYYAAKNLNYCVLEYDYKYCKYRSPQKHIFFEQKCDCSEHRHGKLISIFFAKAKSLWFMSEKQRKHYEEKFLFLEKQRSFVLSSVFDVDTLNFIKGIKTNKNNKWLIVQSNSWIKGTEAALEHAEQHDLDYFLAEDIPYRKMLETLASCKGLIFLPPGMDTCPRLVIEAKLLDCELVINENVQHASEKWFDNKESTFKYLEKRTQLFWNGIKREL